MKLLEIIFFFTPYRFLKKNNEGVLVFFKCALLGTANILTFAVFLLEIGIFEFSDVNRYSRGEFRLIGMISLLPFLIFFILSKNLYKRKFISFLHLSEIDYKRMHHFSNIYIYVTIVLAIISALAYKAMQWENIP